LELRSNVSAERRQHQEKQYLGMASMDEGRQTACSDPHPANADAPSVETLEPDSKVKLTRSRQPSKQPSEMVVIDDGMQIA
jgi:hypothetical protein